MLSVVIPLFNKRSTIQRALDSVLSQTVAPTEIIVVNDGSTDGSGEVARAMGPRVRVIDQSNRGVSAARNTGIEAASGPLIAFLDADDWWQPGFLARIGEMVDRYPDSVLYGTGFTTFAKGKVTGPYGVRPQDLPRSAARQPLPFGPVNAFDAWRHGHSLHPSSMVVPKAAAQAVGGFPEGVSIGEDFIFWCKLALAGSFVLSPEALAVHDVGVPGQLSEYWKLEYRQTLEVLAYHRFLVDTLCTGQGGEAFRRHVQRELRFVLLQRIYRGRFDALDRCWQELGLSEHRLGLTIRGCGWLAGHRAFQPPVGALMRLVRRFRCQADEGQGDAK